jgi:putative membrane protein
MKSITIGAFLCFVLFQACNNSGSGARTSDSVTETDHTGIEDTVSGNNTSIETDMDFVMMAGMGNTAEIEAGRLAEQKAKNGEVKEFGRMMVNDHSEAQSRLKSIASGTGWNPPDSVDAEHKAIKEKLQNLSGDEFDREYINAQVKDHQATVALFERQSTNGANAALREFASSTLPHLRMHLQKAEELQAKLK